MQNLNSYEDNKKHLDEIDLKELFYVLLDGKWIIIMLTSFISIIGLIYSFLSPNIYESKAIMVPVNPSSSISGALRNYSGLVGLAGISMPSSADEGNSAKALEKINSLSFFENNILTNIFLPELMAVKFWDSKTNTLFFDNKIYDLKNNTWIRDYSYPQKKIPSAQESFQVFKSKHISLIEEKNSGFITISMKHQSPYIAKKWIDLVVNEINSFYREKDKLEAEKSVIYLNQQISTTSLSEIKEVLAQLLQEEIKKLTLIEANQHYVFDYIDPPAVMEKNSEPKRLFIFFISAILGAVLSILIVIIMHYGYNKKTF